MKWLFLIKKRKTQENVEVGSNDQTLKWTARLALSSTQVLLEDHSSVPQGDFKIFLFYWSPLSKFNRFPFLL